MGVGKMQGYTGCECRKDNSEIGEEGGDNEEEVVEDMSDVFFWVNQENSHGQEDFLLDIFIFCKHSRRWQEG